MKRFRTIVYALCLCAVMASGAHASTYGWTVSHSATEPLVNSGTPNAGTDTLFLWLYCQGKGMSAAEMDLNSFPAGNVLAFNPMNGFLNAGNATHLLLAVGGCPDGAVVAGSILILHFVPLTVCLQGANVTVDCSADPQAWPHIRRSYADLDLPVCVTDNFVFCDPISVEEESWGKIKTLYR